MGVYRTWLLRRGDEVSGPFPEPLICQQILIGRIKEDDMLSLDGHAWRSYRDIAEIVAEITRMLDANQAAHDPEWGEERIRAVLRHIDERKRPDRRDTESVAQASVWRSRRTGDDRRNVPETVEQHTYRQTLAEVDRWLRKYRLRNRWAMMVLISAVLAIGWTLQHFQTVTPIDIGLKSSIHACNAAPSKGVDWHGCNKSGFLLVGADLRNANLSDANLSDANLSYANLTGAQLTRTQLQGTILKGAVWVDGRVCAPQSVGACLSQ